MWNELLTASPKCKSRLLTSETLLELGWTEQRLGLDFHWWTTNRHSKTMLQYTRQSCDFPITLYWLLGSNLERKLWSMQTRYARCMYVLIGKLPSEFLNSWTCSSRNVFLHRHPFHPPCKSANWIRIRQSVSFDKPSWKYPFSCNPGLHGGAWVVHWRSRPRGSKVADD